MSSWDDEDSGARQTEPTGRSRSGSRRSLGRRGAYVAAESTGLDPMDLFLAGCAAEEDGALARARELYRRASRADDLGLEALRACARMERALGAPVEAARCLIHALHHAAAEPELMAELYAEIGDLQVERGDFDEAAYHYRRAARLAPGDPTIARRARVASQLAGRREPTGVRAMAVEVEVDVSEWDLAV